MYVTPKGVWSWDWRSWFHTGHEIVRHISSFKSGWQYRDVSTTSQTYLLGQAWLVLVPYVWKFIGAYSIHVPCGNIHYQHRLIGNFARQVPDYLNTNLIHQICHCNNCKRFDAVKVIMIRDKVIHHGRAFCKNGYHRENSPVTQTTPEPTLLSWGVWPREKNFPHPWLHGKPGLITLIGPLRPYRSQAFWSCSGVSRK